MLKSFIIAVIISAAADSVRAECANGCSGHGRCTAYDMCVCNRNWMANDCSQRVCQFGLAHVDTPKGDLDMDGAISGANEIIVRDNEVYPYGTTEEFPNTRDTALNLLNETAHYYMECSNKGTCDRSTGVCACYDGYDGAACQRASCPGFPDSCSGHGVCRSIQQLANDDYGNNYLLWDAKSTMGCQCDKGYYGADCSLRYCKYGVDPLYLDDTSTIKYSIFDFAVVTTNPTIDFDDGTPLQGIAYWAIRFYDIFGEDWLTQPIRAGASCDDVISALEDFPNDVIPKGQTLCTASGHTAAAPANDGVTGWYADIDAQSIGDWDKVLKYQLAFWEQREKSSYVSKLALISGQVTDADALAGHIYRIKFFGNPGKLRQPEIEIYLDGKRPSIHSAGKVITKVWTDGQQGENYDYFGDHCDGVSTTMAYDEETNMYYLHGLDHVEVPLLKACLGDADFDTTNNVDVYNWDYGSKEYPHIIKLVRTTTAFYDGGYYAAVYYNGSVFRLLNPFVATDSTSHYSTENYEIYTTKGTLALTSSRSEVAVGFASQEMFFTNISFDQSAASDYDYGTPQVPFDGDVFCTGGNQSVKATGFVSHCLNTSDIFTLLNFELPYLNPPHINLYTAEKLYQKNFNASVWQDRWDTGANAYITTGGDLTRGGVAGAYDAHYKTHALISDLGSNWGVATHAAGEYHQPKFHAYKFFPGYANSTYQYVAECANRGICDTATGICNCFAGYSHDDCSQQNSLHV